MKRALSGLSLTLLIAMQVFADMHAGSTPVSEMASDSKNIEIQGAIAAPGSFPQDNPHSSSNQTSSGDQNNSNNKHFVTTQDWELASQSDDIKIYTADVEHSKFEAFRAEATLDSPLENVFAVIADPESCPLWVDNCIESNNIKVSSFNHRIAYALSALPWPFQDRELIVKIDTSNMSGSDTTTDVITIQMNTLADSSVVKEYTPDPNHVQITQSIARYELSRAPENKTLVIWEQHTEPSGELPSWLVNAMLTGLPKKSLAGLNKTAKLSRYKDAELLLNSDDKLIGLTLSNGEKINNPVENVEQTFQEISDNRAPL